MKEPCEATYHMGWWTCAHCAHEVEDGEDWHLQPCACESADIDHPWNTTGAN